MKDQKELLPIKLVTAAPEDFSKPKPGGGKKQFCDITPEFREGLTEQLNNVNDYFEKAFSIEDLPGVAKVTLKKEAFAKSHKPKNLFTEKTCPIIGCLSFGELLVSVTESNLKRLQEKIFGSGAYTESIKAALSTIEKIEPYTSEDVLGSVGLKDFSLALQDIEKRVIKVKLFDHKVKGVNLPLDESFTALTKSLRLPGPEKLDYGAQLHIYKLSDVNEESLKALSTSVSVQSIDFFPRMHLRTQYAAKTKLTDEKFPLPDPNEEYPLVGMIDSGTDPNNPVLQEWVEIRDEEDVPPEFQDNNHGSFVGGLIANSRALNNVDPRFPSAQSKIVDVVAMPNADTPINEDALLKTIRRALKQYPEVRIWNLSISRKDLYCQDTLFSDFAMALDSMQHEYGVVFVVCAGNYDTRPLRSWPSEDGSHDDRIHPPADTALGMTVGSIAHIARANSLAKDGEPSPFSRRGPGACYLPKPDLTHFGGNCDVYGDCSQVGILSIDASNQISESMGTSFSTPLIATLMANVQKGVESPMSQNLTKALIVHSAALNSEIVHSHYQGFGTPPSDVLEILNCDTWQATLVFELELPVDEKIFSKIDFPIPECFRNAQGAVQGGFLMTLVYDPPCIPAAGAEYCQVNVEVSLGSNDDGEYKGKVPLDQKKYGALSEDTLVKHGFKWSPVKVYKKEYPQGTKGDAWRIHLRSYYRDQSDDNEPQKVALIVTLYDPDKRKPVYDHVTRALGQSNWSTSDLKIDNRLRTRLRT